MSMETLLAHFNCELQTWYKALTLAIPHFTFQYLECLKVKKEKNVAVQKSVTHMLAVNTLYGDTGFK